jgi:hypothetical protein
MTDLNTTENTTDAIESIDSFYSDEMVKLNSSFAKMITKKNEELVEQNQPPIQVDTYLPVSAINAKLYPKIKSLFLTVLNFFEITDKDAPFIKFQVNENGYKGIQLPSIGTVGTDIALMMGSKSYNITKTWAKKDKGNSLRQVMESGRYYAYINSEDLELSSIKLSMYMQEHDKDKPISMVKMSSVPFALSVLAPLTFSTNTLSDGVYSVVSFAKKGDNCTAIINDKGVAKRVYIWESQFKNLVTCKEENRDTNLIVDGFRVTKKGERRNVYVEGFPPINYKSFSQMIEQYLADNNLPYTLMEICPSYKLKDEDIKGLITTYGLSALPENEAKDTAVKEFRKIANENADKVLPIKFKVNGFQKVEKGQYDTIGVRLIVEYDKILHHVKLTSPIERDYLNGVLDIDNFDNCYVVVTEVGTYQAYFSFKTKWQIPVNQMNLDGVNELENMLFPIPGLSN